MNETTQAAAMLGSLGPPRLFAMLQDLKRVAPMPWYMEQNNNEGVCVKDNRGNDVFYDDFGTIPDELSTEASTQIREKSRTLAQFLVALSETLRP